MKRAAMTLVAILAAATAAQATPVTSLPGGTVYPMPVVNYVGPGPQVFSGITWTSTNATHGGGGGGSAFGYTNLYGSYSFAANGSWDGGLGPMAGLNDSYHDYGVTDTMTFTFPSPVYGVGGFLNYVPNGGTPTTIAVYDAANNLIESYNLTFLTGGGTNTGEFHGFLEGSPTIKSFTLTDNYVGLTDLTVQTQTPVPEPTTLLLLGTGLVGFTKRRFRWGGR